MGWGYCGTDDKGRAVGYTIPATCDHEGCSEEIDRGISYVCGNMHGGAEIDLPNGEFFITCGGYFCSKHLHHYGDNPTYQICPACLSEIEKLEKEITKCQQIQ